jgi:hypothetical protein
MPTSHCALLARTRLRAALGPPEPLCPVAKDLVDGALRKLRTRCRIALRLPTQAQLDGIDAKLARQLVDSSGFGRCELFRNSRRSIHPYRIISIRSAILTVAKNVKLNAAAALAWRELSTA